ncbi:MAG: hypothetical protein K6F20_13075 [Bacteroidaceae bacterium]|nr:hypothetical protein [Bacteroidaceae bacterium]
MSTSDINGEGSAPSQPAGQAQVRRMSAGTRQVIMNPQQLERAREAKRLAEAKLRNTEEALESLRTQQEWIRRYNEVVMALDLEKQRLNGLTKQMASLAEESYALKRYEAFESVQGTFQRLQILEKLKEQNANWTAESEREYAAIQDRWDGQQIKQKEASALSAGAEERLYHTIADAIKGSWTDGTIDALREEAERLTKAMEKLRQQEENLQGIIDEGKEETDMLAGELERQRAGRQSMEMHERMLEHGEAILQLLDRLQEIEEHQQTLRVKQDESARRQDEENEMLGHVFRQYQEVEAEIEALSKEMSSHRFNIQGQNSYALQERTMSLKNRRQMLLSAQSLWNRISTGYNLIEEKSQELNALRLHIEQTEASIKELESVVGRQEMLCHEKEYTFLLSKSQNVIQLRSDLREGTGCPVCGALHHPYHSDTMLEQSKLINEFKTDFELLNTETRSKKRTLDELRLDLAESRGRRQAEEANLTSVRRRQAEDVREWRVFTSLDQSFQDCSPTTNLEARQALLRQLIENTTNDAEKAQKELDTFNYHQGCIYDLSEKIQILEQKKNELSTRLNEVNTGCQVMAGLTERLQQQVEQEGKYYSLTYAKLDRQITITDWLKEWRQSHETLRGRIQKLMNIWQSVNQRIEELKGDLEKEKAQTENAVSTQKLIKAQIEAMTERKTTCAQLIGEYLKEKERILGTTGAKETLMQQYEQMMNCRRAEQTEQKETSQMQHEADYIRGRIDNYNQENTMLSGECQSERILLDHWIRDFNAQNAPVQYSELEQILNQGRDWNALREKLNGIEKEMIMSQTRFDSLNSKLVALQAEGGRGHINTDEMQAMLVVKREEAEGKRRDIMIEIARLDVALEEHQKAVGLKERLENDSVT